MNKDRCKEGWMETENESGCEAEKKGGREGGGREELDHPELPRVSERERRGVLRRRREADCCEI